MIRITCALFAAALSGALSISATAHDETAYAPMKPFAELAGHVYRGEGTGPDGAPIVDYAKWEFILGGRALQSSHRFEDGSYSGITIYFYDEGAEEHLFHYFTNAGFHSIGTIEATETGFVAVETVEGHPEIVEVRAQIIVEEDGMQVSSEYVNKDGSTTPSPAFVYREYDGEVPHGEL